MDSLTDKNLKIKIKNARSIYKKSRSWVILLYKKYFIKNNQIRRHSNLTKTQKHIKFAKIIRIHGILPKHDPKIYGMDIVDDKFISKK